MIASLHTGTGRGVDTLGHSLGLVCPMKGEVRVLGVGRVGEEWVVSFLCLYHSELSSVDGTLWVQP